MKALTNPDTNFNRLFSTVQPIILLKRCCGIFRLRVDRELSVPLPFNRRVRVLGFFIYLFIAVSYLTLTFGFVTDINVPRTVQILPSIMIFFQYSVTITRQLFYDDIANIHILTAVENIDYSLHVNTNNDFYKKSRAETMKLLFLLATSYVSMMIFNIFDEVEIKIEFFVSLLLYFECELEILFFYKLMGLLRERVVIINNYLSKFATQRLDNKTILLKESNKAFVIEQCLSYIGRASANNMKIRDLAETYYQIGAVCEMINRIFNLAILTTFISTFLFIIITFWSSLLYFQTNKTFRYLLKIVVWSSTQIIAVVMLSINCEKLLKVKQTTKLLVNRLIMDYDLPKAMRVQAKVFMDIINIWPLRVFIYDMFSTDLQMTFKVISLCETYVILVIQVTHLL
nr:gustatory receptor 22 [Papilio glaucus]